ncbi:TonB-dependent receptor [Neolewinella marina]|uniref:TonB-dependent receptor n=1 Tax=Neolewinella marina TaxID=438751 RepID=A0A2G0CKM0_9BACT|nr:TonB-dependent receptor [Neolewinella marina]PHL00517.1 TonB-dependent receptor [Neolewinella marina]
MLLANFLSGQGYTASGVVVGTDGLPLELVSVQAEGEGRGTFTEADGTFTLKGLPEGTVTLRFSSLGFQPWREEVHLGPGDEAPALTIVLEERGAVLEQVVVSGNLKEVSRSSSPVPIEVYTAQYFAANPAPNFFESLQQVNGVRPQLNCNVCNTGDIHINGLEGPYTMVLLDGMPIVSGLSTVYGLTGIPQRLVERMEVVKGPASTLYGSEAVGGLINIITQRPGSGPKLVADAMVTSWGETNIDLGLNQRIGEGSSTLLGVNYFRYANPIDNNGDNFTDVTLQDRISVFNKWTFDRADGRDFTLAARYLYEDRWGGELNFGPAFRGGDEVYGESIYTNRWESIGSYQLAVPGEAFFRFSLNGHYHDSAYGNTIYLGKQYIGFGQLTYRPELTGRHDLLFGTAYRYTWYDDNTTATGGETGNAPSVTSLPGAFVQDEFRINRHNTLLLGLRFDHNNRHGAILTPRLNYKWNDRDQSNVFRLSIGNGYRVANVFTEDHAALTGARQVVFAAELQPETSWNANVNYVRRIYDWDWGIVGLDASLWYTRFGNRILPDYESNPNQIIYDNLDGYAVSRGGSLNVDLNLTSGTLANLGITLQDVFVNEDGTRQRQLLTEGASAVWKITQPFPRGWSVDYTGNLYGPMRLPLLGELDNRPAMSPWFSLQNIQVTKAWGESVEVYGGVKNLLNYTPPANSIARPFDPFDREVAFGADGQVLATPNNPHALTFDPSYVFAPNQGIRLFLGFRYSLP